MAELSKLAKTVKDILECRIDAVLEDMSTTALCELPEDEPVTMEKFMEITVEVVSSASKYLTKYVVPLCVCFHYLFPKQALVNVSFELKTIWKQKKMLITALYTLLEIFPQFSSDLKLSANSFSLE